MIKHISFHILSCVMGALTLIWVYGKFDLPLEAYLIGIGLFFWMYIPVIAFFSLFYYFYLKKD